jgi:hypothetical protein
MRHEKTVLVDYCGEYFRGRREENAANFQDAHGHFPECQQRDRNRTWPKDTAYVFACVS